MFSRIKNRAKRLRDRLLKWDERRVLTLLKKLELRGGGFRWLASVGRVLQLKAAYKRRLGRPLSLRSPQRLSEKLQWMKLKGNLAVLAPLVDKLAVKPIVTRLIGEEHVLRTLAVWKSETEFDPAPLPTSFMLKTNHGSGRNLTVPDKLAVDWAAQRQTLSKWLRSSYDLSAGEPQYGPIEPRLFAEEFLPFSPDWFSDVRFYVMAGEIEFIIAERLIPTKTSQLLDPNWRTLDVGRTGIPRYSGNIPRPRDWEKLVEATLLLARPFPFVRVDWLVTETNWYFSELTFTPVSGYLEYTRDEFDFQFGRRLPLVPHRFPEEWGTPSTVRS